MQKKKTEGERESSALPRTALKAGDDVSKNLFCRINQQHGCYAFGKQTEDSCFPESFMSLQHLVFTLDDLVQFLFTAQLLLATQGYYGVRGP